MPILSASSKIFWPSSQFFDLTQYFLITVKCFWSSTKYWTRSKNLDDALKRIWTKGGFFQKGLMRLSFLRTGKPDYFPELKFWIIFPSKWLKSCQKRTLSCSNAFFDHSEELQVLFWHDLSNLEGKKNKMLAQENN